MKYRMPKPTINKKLAILLVIILIAVSCSTNEKADAENEVKTVRSVSMSVVKAWNEGDYDGFIKFIDDGAILFPQGAPPVKGIKSISSLYSASFESNTFEVSDSNEEIQVFGDFAFEIGTWVGSINPKDGSSPFKINNSVISIYKRQKDGAWKIYRMMYNQNDVPEITHIPDIPE
ncbi:YybH family protein [Bacteroidota bacterium]